MANFSAVIAGFRSVMWPGRELSAGMLWLGRVIATLCGLVPRRHRLRRVGYARDSIETCVPATTIEVEFTASGGTPMGRPAGA